MGEGDNKKKLVLNVVYNTVSMGEEQREVLLVHNSCIHFHPSYITISANKPPLKLLSLVINGQYGELLVEICKIIVLSCQLSSAQVMVYYDN